MKKLSGKKAAMEMSVGTIVTIVLLMTVLVLGIFFVQKIFRGGTNAIDTIDNEIQNQINQLFVDDSNPKKLVIYPTSREISVEKGDNPKGFAFSVKNLDVNSADFTYDVSIDDVSACQGNLNKEQADAFLLGGSGSFSLGSGNQLDLARLVKLSIPETAPICTIIYVLEIKKGTDSYASGDIFVTIK